MKRSITSLLKKDSASAAFVPSKKPKEEEAVTADQVPSPAKTPSNAPPQRGEADMYTRSLAPSEYIISPGSTYQKVMERFREMWGVRKHGDGKVMPGPNPVSISRKALSEIIPSDYLVIEKTDGVRYDLVLCIDEMTGNNIAVMIDRSLKMYQIEVICKKSYFQGSLFEGELAWETRSDGTKFLVYWVFEAVCVCGVSLKEKNYVDRLAEIERCFLIDVADRNVKRDTNGITSGAATLEFRPKQCYVCTDVDVLWTNMKKANHITDGLILMPIWDPIQTHTHWRQFKWKDKHHTLDLQLRAQKKDVPTPQDEPLGPNETTAWKFCLYYVEADFTVLMAAAEDKQRGIQEGAAYKNACQGIKYEEKEIKFVLKENAVLQRLLATVETKHPTSKFFSCIVECEVEFDEEDTLACHIYRIRTDKSEPNNRFTVRQTILNLLEAISFDDIRSACLY